MFGATELIVYLWFLPVTLCIIVPLVMLVGWSLGHLLKPSVRELLKPLYTSKRAAEKQEERVIGGDIFPTVRA